ncbi:MAG: helix-turn-helix transcriptional regulator [Lentisphaeria bacterium]|nr:helix-turn-helix transcriptional regulator [Lentisphaeria bacterium]
MQYHHFKLEKYTSDLILCNFMRPFLSFDQARDTRHCHEDFYELVIFVDGTVLDKWNENVQILQPGQFFMYAPGSIHHYENMLNTKYFNILVHQDLIEENLSLAKDCMPGFGTLFPDYGERSAIFQLDDSGLRKAIDVAFEIKREQDEKAAGHREMMHILLEKLLILLWRNRKSQNAQQDNILSFRISQSLTFMEKNLARNLTLREIAQHVSMSESAFRHYFKAVTSFSPIQYLVFLRLKNALQLIFVGRNVNECAKLSGLRDSSYLGRMCRRYLGCPLPEIVNILHHPGTTPEMLIEKLIHNLKV